MANGRGAWPNAGTGGTKAYKNADKPGPYYYLGSGSLSQSDPNAYAVRHAVKAYQNALNRRNPNQPDLLADGLFGPQTLEAVTVFQSKHTDLLSVWGGIGPDTSMLLLLPDLRRIVEQKGVAPLSATIVSGIIRHESGWDAGAVGFVDPHDLGLAQINGPSHPDLSASERFRPGVAFNFVVSYMNNALKQFGGNIRDAIASYNLGIGGANTWIKQGRPQMFTPTGTTTPRDVWAYINSVLEG